MPLLYPCSTKTRVTTRFVTCHNIYYAGAVGTGVLLPTYLAEEEVLPRLRIVPEQCSENAGPTTGTEFGLPVRTNNDRYLPKGASNRRSYSSNEVT
jgi:hypothetical protein